MVKHLQIIGQDFALKDLDLQLGTWNGNPAYRNLHPRSEGILYPPRKIGISMSMIIYIEGG